jgi:hypothetical protein
MENSHLTEAIYKYEFDRDDMRALYRSQKLILDAFNLDSQKLERNIVIDFKALALAIDPDNDGLIDAGYIYSGIDPESGPYSDWTEVLVEPEDYYRAAFGKSRGFQVSKDMQDIFIEKIIEGAHKVLNSRLDKSIAP